MELTPGGVQTTLGVTGLSDPAAVAVYTSRAGFQQLWVADYGNNRLEEAVMVSGVVTGQAAAITGLFGPMGVAVDSFGDAFVTDTGSNRVVGLSVSGVQTIYGFTGLKLPYGIAQSPVRAVRGRWRQQQGPGADVGWRAVRSSDSPVCTRRSGWRWIRRTTCS